MGKQWRRCKKCLPKKHITRITRTIRTKELQLELQERNDQQPEMNNTPEGINNRITEVEERISDLKDGMVEITAVAQNIEKRMKRNEDSLRDVWDNIKCSNISIIGVSEGEERERRT